MQSIAERQSSNPGITDAQQLGLLTAAVGALVAEMQADRADRKAERANPPSWHLVMVCAAVLGASVGCFFALAVLHMGGRLGGLTAASELQPEPVGVVSR